MAFPDLHIHQPQSAHTHTAILLHGRGSDGPEFSEDFLHSTTSKNISLVSSLPNWRWVFPTSRNRWCTRFEEDMCTWFDAYSLNDITERQELQITGLRDSVSYILDVLEKEIALLDGRASHVYLGGISQGMATALWAMFCAARQFREPLGGFVGFCGWLPFAQRLEGLDKHSQIDQQPTDTEVVKRLDNLFDELFPRQSPRHDASLITKDTKYPIFSTPVFLCHGTDDIWVPVELGRQVARSLGTLMNHVEWKEFTGAGEDGHWIKEPEGFDQILNFLESVTEGQST